MLSLPRDWTVTRPQGVLTPQSPAPKQPPDNMSSTSSPTSAHAASVKKIANYTKSISTGVTNLLTEIGRVSASSATAPAPAPAPATGTDPAILLQLQALTGQIVGLVNRIDEVQRMVGGLEKRLDDMGTSPSDIRWELKNQNHTFVSR